MEQHFAVNQHAVAVENDGPKNRMSQSSSAICTAFRAAPFKS